MASKLPNLLSSLNTFASNLVGKSASVEAPLSRTCSTCNDLLVNESSRAIILHGNSPFQYRRKSQHLEANASSGCVLCQQLLDRHTELGPKDASDNICPSSCPWSTFGRDNLQPVFLVQSVKDDRYPDEGLRLLKIRGFRRAGQRHEVLERSHFWELVYEVTSDNGT